MSKIDNSNETSSRLIGHEHTYNIDTLDPFSDDAIARVATEQVDSSRYFGEAPTRRVLDATTIAIQRAREARSRIA